MMPLTINEEPYQYSEEEKYLIASDYTSYWLKAQIERSAKRDCLDALRDAETLADLLRVRTKKALGSRSVLVPQTPKPNLLVKQMRKWNQEKE